MAGAVHTQQEFDSYRHLRETKAVFISTTNSAAVSGAMIVPGPVDPEPVLEPDRSLAENLLSRLYSKSASAMIGCFNEEYNEVKQTRGWAAAEWNYFSQVTRSIAFKLSDWIIHRIKFPS